MGTVVQSDEEIRAALEEHGSIRATAAALDYSPTTLIEHCQRRGIQSPAAARLPRTPGPRSRKTPPTITRESLHKALVPPNLCHVRIFLDTLDEESRLVVEEALDYDGKDFKAKALREWLIDQGCAAADVPGQDAINDHRAGRRPCRCRG